MSNSLRDRYSRDGFVAPVELLSEDEAAGHRQRLELAETQLGPLHYRDKIHTLLGSPYNLASDPRVLDVVEELIGPDVLLYNATYIIKEPRTTTHVAWHQDLTYWGLEDDDAQVSMWLALAPATKQSGCMQMIPGSHTTGPIEHRLGNTNPSEKDNLLLQDQRIEAVDDSTAEVCALRPGEASFHHGWTVHSSPPNTSDDRRIGLNVQYLAPHNRSLGKVQQSALLVRGVDPHGFFNPDPTPGELTSDAIAAHTKLHQQMKAGFSVDDK